jgi:hypothetical protein
MAAPDNTLISGATNLLNAAGGWISGLGAAGGGTMVGYHALMRNLNDDPQSVAHHTASMKKVIVGSVIIVAAGAIVKLVTGYF